MADPKSKGNLGSKNQPSSGKDAQRPDEENVERMPVTLVLDGDSNTEYGPDGGEDLLSGDEKLAFDWGETVAGRETDMGLRADPVRAQDRFSG